MSIRKIFYWYFSRKTLPYWCIFILDCVLVFLSIFFTTALNQGPSYTYNHFWQIAGALAVYDIFFALGFRFFHTYSGIIRYSSFVDLHRIAYAMTIGLGLSLVFKFTGAPALGLIPIRMRDMIFGALLAMLLMWSIRVIVKHIFDSYYRMAGAENVFIFGVREGGIGIAKSIRNQSPAKYVVKGFVSHNPDDRGKMLMGVRVHSFDAMLADTMLKVNATAIFVSPNCTDQLRTDQAIVDQLIKQNIKIFMMPHEQPWDGKSLIEHHQFQEVKIEDLLPRQQIDIDMDAIGRQLSGKTILITGAAGSIGSEIVRQVARFGPAKLVLIDQAETPLHDIRLMMARNFLSIPAHTIVSDITQKSLMESIFAEHRPQYVFHAAAYKHVPMMEDNPGESVHNNVEGTRVMADLSVKYGVDKFVMISTDKAVNPTNVMGASKRICEIYVQSLDKALKDGFIHGHTQFVTTRFGNVLGSNGSVIPLFREQIRRGGPVTVTHPDIIRYFMLIPEACSLVLEAGTMGKGGEIFVFDMGEPVRIVDLAKRMIRLSGNPDIEIRFTGLRDGEKLYEEVLTLQETTLPTFHPKIKIAKVRELQYTDASQRINHLIQQCYVLSDMEVVRIMKTIVPEFRSQHSKYQQLDEGR